MKKEMMRCQHFGREENAGQRAYDISFTLFRREILGLLGLSEYEKQEFILWLAGQRQHPNKDYDLRLRGEAFSPGLPRQVLTDGIFFICHGISEFLSMSAGENLMLLPGKPGNSAVFRKLKLPEVIEEYWGRFLPEVDLEDKMGNLSLVQRYLLLLLKAVYFHGEVVVLDLWWDAFHQKDLERLEEMLEVLKKRGMSFVVFLQNAGRYYEICQRLEVFRYGNPVCTFEKENYDHVQILKCLQGAEYETENQPKRKTTGGEVFLQVEKLRILNHVGEYSFCLKKGEVTGFIDLEKYDFLELADALFGLCGHYQERLEIQGRACGLASPWEAWEKGIYLFHSPNDQDHTFQGMDGMENLLLPWEKSSAYPGGFLRRKFLRHEYKIVSKKNGSRQYWGNQQGYKSQNICYTNQEKLKMMFEQIQLLDRRMVIFKNPAKGLNYQDMQYVYCHIREAADTGRAVLVLSSDMGEIRNFCDRWYYMKNGTIYEERNREKI